MKIYKSLMVVAIVGVLAIPSEAGDLLKAATENAKPIAMGECLSICSDAGCMRDCIANVEGFLGPRAVAQHPLEDCFGEALSNITSCAAVILLRADDVEFDVDFAFWACVQVASQRFDQCHADDPGLSLELETKLRRMYLGHLVNAAEDDYKLYLAGKLTADRLNVDLTSDGGDTTPPQEQREAEPEKTFSECLADYIDNLGSCVSQCGSNSTCLAGCEKVALKKFDKSAVPSTT